MISLTEARRELQNLGIKVTKDNKSIYHSQGRKNCTIEQGTTLIAILNDNNEVMSGWEITSKEELKESCLKIKNFFYC